MYITFNTDNIKFFFFSREEISGSELYYILSHGPWDAYASPRQDGPLCNEGGGARFVPVSVGGRTRRTK